MEDWFFGCFGTLIDSRSDLDAQRRRLEIDIPSMVDVTGLLYLTAKADPSFARRDGSIVTAKPGI